MAEEFHRILIVRTDRIGDVILTLPMAKALKRRYPSSRISMLIRQYTSELVASHPSVDGVVFFDRGEHHVPFFQLLKDLRAGKYELVFHTHPRFRLAFLTWLAGIPVRVGTGYRWYSIFFNRRVYEHRKDAKRHELEYNLNLLDAIGCPVQPGDVRPVIAPNAEAAARVEQLLASRGVHANERLVILHPGSGGSARDWSAAKFVELGKQLLRDQDARIVVTGGQAELDLVRSVAAEIGPGALPLAGEMNLTEYAALARRASLFVANSTGTIHIAAAVGVPVIGLYSQITPLSAKRWGPYTDRKVIFTPAGKSDTCNLCGNGDACACMDSITVEEVLSSAKRILAETEVATH